MLRIPNPGSDIDSFIRIYVELFEALRERVNFDVDDISRVLVERNLATSSGFMGEEALRRSFNKNRSLDKLYAQSKSYSELYRALGWIHPTREGALRFRFTYFGAHVADARRDPAAIFKESILGIAYPNAILKVKGNYILRPFATILRTMAELDGLLHKDEMIVGPLSLDNDTDKSKFDAMVIELKSLRRGWSYLEEKLNAVADGRRIETGTLGNYTRFPIAVMKWTKWARDERRPDYYGRANTFLVLTDEGRRVLQHIEACRDLRAAEIQAADALTRDAIVRIGFYQMLDRAGFEMESVQVQLAADMVWATPFLKDARPLLFSPFQELDPQYVDAMFPDISGTKLESASRLQPLETPFILPQLVSEVSLAGSVPNPSVHIDHVLESLFRDAAQQVGNNLNHIVDYIAEQYRGANKGVFYPFVAKLFTALGYQCDYSRPGVNYQRWDAIIIDPQYSIPIEIKSPGEEEFLSVKAVRQALENKIILLSRKSYPTEAHITSLAVGYNLPNDRSEVASLIADIHKAFGVLIGVIDLRSLLRLVAATVLQGKNHNINELRTLHGIIRVADA